MKRRVAPNITKTDTGSYEVRLKKSSKWIRKRFKTLGQAKQFRDLLLADRALTRAGMKSIVAAHPTIEEMVSRYLRDAELRGLAPRSLKRYKQCLRGPVEL